MSNPSIATPVVGVKTAAVYAIECSATGRVYVGSSKHLSQRWFRHRRDLEQNIHHCQPLQDDYNRHGAAVFTFRILERCDVAEQWDCEQRWMIELHARETGYNVYDNLGNASRLHRNGDDQGAARTAWGKLFG